MVQESRLVDLLVSLYNRNLWQEMRWIENNIDQFTKGDDRMDALVNALYEGSDRLDYDGKVAFGKEMSAKELKEFGWKKFPLCMSEVNFGR